MLLGTVCYLHSTQELQEDMPSLVMLVNDQPDIGQAVEDNILALLDTVGVKNTNDIEDDKLSFLEAVHSLCIAGMQPKAPTCRVHKAVFQLLEGNNSMVLNMASYSLLVQIAQQYPHILVKENTCTDRKTEIILNNKIWSPFRSDFGAEEKSRSGFSTRQAIQGQQCWEDFVCLLKQIQTFIGGETNVEELNIRNSSYKFVGLVMKFNYCFKVLDQDFKCWFQAYKDFKEKEIMSSCYLVHLFDKSREKSLIELLFNLIASSRVSSHYKKELLHLQEFSLNLQALVEMKLSLELEKMRISSRNLRKSRGDTTRNLEMDDLFIEIFHFNKDLLQVLLEVMDDSDCKWRIIVADFLNTIPKPLAKEKIRDPNNVTAQDLLGCFDDINSARNVFNTIDGEMLQYYLASCFKFGLRDTRSDGISTATLDLCKSLKTAFQNLQNITDDFYDLHPIARQALTTAETMIILAQS